MADEENKDTQGQDESSLAEDLTRAAERVEQTEQQIDAAQDQADSLQQQAEDVKAQADELQAQAEEKREQIRQAQEIAAQAQEMKDEVDEKKRWYEERKARMEEKKRRAEETVARWKAMLGPFAPLIPFINRGCTLPGPNALIERSCCACAFGRFHQRCSIFTCGCNSSAALPEEHLSEQASTFMSCICGSGNQRRACFSATTGSGEQRNSLFSCLFAGDGNQACSFMSCVAGSGQQEQTVFTWTTGGEARRSCFTCGHGNRYSLFSCGTNTSGFMFGRCDSTAQQRHARGCIGCDMGGGYATTCVACVVPRQGKYQEVSREIETPTAPEGSEMAAEAAGVDTQPLDTAKEVVQDQIDDRPSRCCSLAVPFPVKEYKEMYMCKWKNWACIGAQLLPPGKKQR